MKSFQIDRRSFHNKSFTTKRHLFPNFLKVWHYHVEFELVLVLKSTGTRFIGDNIEQFTLGDLILIGKNLPHMWLNDKEYFDDNPELKAEAIAIHFKDDFAGNDFLKMPEMMGICNLLHRADRGIKFLGNVSDLSKQIKKIHELEGFEKTIEFLHLLNELANHKQIKELSTTGFITSFNGLENTNLGNVYEYIIKNFKKSITLEEVASIANMNPSSFSRFFKRTNRKTYSGFLNEVRIGYACKLLIENKYNITQICYECGFNNISNFNRQFKNVTKYSPTQYLKFHVK